MTVLSAQSIRRLCNPPIPLVMIDPSASHRPYERHKLVDIPPLLTPFSPRGLANGKSYGLSACTYDCRIDQDLTLAPMPFDYIQQMLAYLAERQNIFESFMRAGDHTLPLPSPPIAPTPSPHPWRALASTMERFAFPHNIRGHVLDKSSYARLHVSAFNTHFDPGFTGHATIELVNLGPTTVTYRRGDPVCQFLFEWLDEPTDSPYTDRKYSDQPNKPVPMIEEK